MKQEDKKYEEWLTEIKNKQPILENPEERTAAILNKITDNAPKKKKIRYLVGAWISGTAATLLLFLFINDACFPPPLPKQKRKMDMSISQTALHFPYRRTGKKCNSWRKVPTYPLNTRSTGSSGRREYFKL